MSIIENVEQQPDQDILRAEEAEAALAHQIQIVTIAEADVARGNGATAAEGVAHGMAHALFATAHTIAFMRAVTLVPHEGIESDAQRAKLKKQLMIEMRAMLDAAAVRLADFADDLLDNTEDMQEAINAHKKFCPDCGTKSKSS